MNFMAKIWYRLREVIKISHLTMLNTRSKVQSNQQNNQEKDVVTSTLPCETKDLKSPITHSEFHDHIFYFDIFIQVLVKALTINWKELYFNMIEKLT